MLAPPLVLLHEGYPENPTSHTGVYADYLNGRGGHGRTCVQQATGPVLVQYSTEADGVVHQGSFAVLCRSWLQSWIYRSGCCPTVMNVNLREPKREERDSRLSDRAKALRALRVSLPATQA